MTDILALVITVTFSFPSMLQILISASLSCVWTWDCLLLCWPRSSCSLSTIKSCLVRWCRPALAWTNIIVLSTTCALWHHNNQPGAPTPSAWTGSPAAERWCPPHWACSWSAPPQVCWPPRPSRLSGRWAVSLVRWQLSWQCWQCWSAAQSVK